MIIRNIGMNVMSITISIPIGNVQGLVEVGVEVVIFDVDTVELPPWVLGVVVSDELVELVIMGLSGTIT